MSDLDQLTQYMAQSSDAPISNPNHAPVVPIVEALVEAMEEYRAAKWLLRNADVSEIDECNKLVRITARTLADLILEACEIGAKLDME